MKAVIFDFDGTIADSSYVWQKVDYDFFSKRGMSVPADYVDAISTMSFTSGAIYTKEKYNIKETIEEIMNEWNSHALYEYENNVTLKPYVKEYIKKLSDKGIKMGIATASNPEFYKPVLKREGVINYIEAFADGSDNVRNKDFPDIYKLCAKRLGVTARDCLVYEDVIKGIKSAKLANMKTVAVFDNHRGNNWESIKMAADNFIMDFSEML
ncbi:MAG: HAD family hydrolase [Lachnospirales bacterium]